MAEKFIKKPVVIEAMPFYGSWKSAKPILEWIDVNKALDLSGTTWSAGWAGGKLWIHTLEGTLTASAGDWIIRGIKGEFYPCKPDIFKETYEPAFVDAQDGPKDSDFCSVCENALKPDDICASDIELGICHAACLEGSPAVDLDTGEPCETMHTFRYGQLPDDAVGEISTPRHPVVRYRIGIDCGDVFVTGGDYDGMTLVLEAADLSDAQAMLQAIAAPATIATAKMDGFAQGIDSAADYIDNLADANEAACEHIESDHHEMMGRDYRRLARAIRAIAPPASATVKLEGWKLLPIEPTKEMAFAGINAVTKGQKYDDPRDPQFAADMKACGGDKGAVRAMQSYRAMLAAAPPAPHVAGIEDGIERAARYLEKQRDDYVQEFGNYDPSTGVTEFSTAGEEYLSTLEELIDGIRAISTTEGQS